MQKIWSYFFVNLKYISLQFWRLLKNYSENQRKSGKPIIPKSFENACKQKTCSCILYYCISVLQKMHILVLCCTTCTLFMYCSILFPYVMHQSVFPVLELRKHFKNSQLRWFYNISLLVGGLTTRKITAVERLFKIFWSLFCKME